MGLFNKERGKSGKHHNTTIIAEGAKVTGELTLSGNIQVDGKVSGKLQTDKLVTISPSGRIDGEIYAEKAIINGLFEGEIFAKSIEILGNGQLKGEVSSSELIIHKGGVFLGNSKTVSDDEVINLSDKKEKVQNAS
ncbi:polymer-forming cytoskeletal protein [Vibrio sp. HN007]|uniref:bactofilin family protein n=1 Tax=Vibrio iocasae TaxID=3098914 RepID=UPI0035D48FD9